MQHSKGHRKFGRVTKQRVALMYGLAVNLIEHGKIKTTQAKAKELKPFIEKLITKAKNPTLRNRRLLFGKIDKKSVNKLIDPIAKDCAERKGGYTRVRLLAPRLSDGAKMAIIEFVKNSTEQK